jgi:ADP-ribosylglycohydrolase
LRDELVTHFGPDSPLTVTGSTEVVDSLKSAVIACEERNFERVVRRAVAFGRASGTTACLAGGIAGIRHGPSGIPERWLKVLRGEVLYAPLLKRLDAPTDLGLGKDQY